MTALNHSDPVVLQISGATSTAVGASNKVLRNTYLLLSMTLAFSALVTAVSVAMKLPAPGLLVTLGGYFGLLFLVTKFRDRAAGLGLVFALTGFMGYTLGPIISHYLGLAHGSQIVMTSFLATGCLFAGLSAYALISRRNFNFMGAFIGVGVLVAFGAGLAAIFFTIPALSLAVSAMFVLLMSGLILFETSNIIHGGETNYVMATVTLYVAIFNLFTSLLQLLGFVGGDD